MPAKGSDDVAGAEGAVHANLDGNFSQFSADVGGNNFDGLTLGDMLVVEICAGSARITKTFPCTRHQRLGGGQNKGSQLWH